MNLNRNYQLRINEGDLDAFKNRCDKLHRTHSEMMRELITAFNEGRVSITPAEGQNLEEIYK